MIQNPNLKLKLLCLCASVVSYLVLSFSSAQTVYNTASLAVPLSNLEGSARDLGMGSAFVGVADDTSALFFNPAGLSGLHYPEVALHHNSYLAGTFQETLTAGFPAGELGGFAFALNYIGWGSLDLRDNFGVSQGSFSDSDVGFTAAWGMEWLKGFSAGLALRGVQQKVVTDLYTSLAGDLGVLWRATSRLRLGASYQNLGTPVAGNSLAQQANAGGSYLFALDSHSTLLTALSGSWTPGSEALIQTGLEGTLDGRWSLRGGWQAPFFDNQIGGLTGFTAGAGARFGALTLDYAYVPFGVLGTSNRISLSLQFDLPKEVVKVPVQVPVTVVEPAPVPVGNPQDVEVHFKISNDPLAQGQGLEKEGKTNDAIKVYIDALKNDPKNDQLWAVLGRDYYQLGKKNYAIQCFETVLKLKPNNQALRDWLEQYKSRPSQ